MDIQELPNLLQNRNILSNLFIFIIFVLLTQIFDTKLLVAGGIVLFIMLNYNEIIRFGNTTEDTKKAIKKGTISDDMYYNKKVHDILDKLSKFKKYNRVTFKTGVKYMRKFFKTIHILEKDDILHYNQYFENAFMYLKTAINNFQSITISLPERDYIDALKYGDYETSPFIL